ncbi:MAG: hypothetical protein ACT4QG_04090 [Sporichthyaceae bacterium]
MDWVAVSVGSVVVVLGLFGMLFGVRVRGLGAGLEPRRDGLGHFLLGGALSINAGLKLADSENSLLLATGFVAFVAGVAVLVQGRMRAARAARS